MTDSDLKTIAKLVGDEINGLEQRQAERRRSDAAKISETMEAIPPAVKDLLERTLRPLAARISELERQLAER